MWSPKGISLILLGLGYVSASIDVHERSQFQDRIVSMDGKQVMWSVEWPTDSRVEFLGFRELSLLIRCDFRPIVKKQFQTKYIKICFKYRSPAFYRCAFLYDRHRRYEHSVGPATVQLTFDPVSGANATFTKIPIQQELPLFYVTCRMQTESSFFKSNRLFVLDLRRNFPKNMITRAESLELNRNAGKNLKCLEKPLGIDAKLRQSKQLWRQPAVPVQFEWFFCSGASLTACEASKKPLLELRKNFSDWPAQVREDGQLYVPFVPNKIARILENKRLICYVMKLPVAFYSSRFKIIEKKASTPLVMVRPIRTEEIILYDSKDYSMILPCNFNISKEENFFITWEFRNKRKERVFHRESNSPKRTVSIAGDNSSITFQGPFSEEIEGEYKCIVKSESRIVSGSYKVTYKGPPRTSDKVPNVKFAVEGGTVNVRCLFRDHTRIRPSLDVCGIEIDFQNRWTINKTRDDVNYIFPKSSPTKFFVNLVRPRQGNEIFYTQVNVTRRVPEIPLCHITCVGYQPPFGQRHLIKIVTLPRPGVHVRRKDAEMFEAVFDQSGNLKANVTTQVFWYKHDCNETSESGSGGLICKGLSCSVQNVSLSESKCVRLMVNLVSKSSGEVFHSFNKTESVLLPVVSSKNSSLVVIVTVPVIFVVIFVVTVIIACVIRFRKQKLCVSDASMADGEQWL